MPTALIVDDEQHVRLLIEQELEELEELEDDGVELQTASDGETALEGPDPSAGARLPRRAAAGAGRWIL